MLNLYKFCRWINPSDWRRSSHQYFYILNFSLSLLVSFLPLFLHSSLFQSVRICLFIYFSLSVSVINTCIFSSLSHTLKGSQQPFMSFYSKYKAKNQEILKFGDENPEKFSTASRQISLSFLFPLKEPIFFRRFSCVKRLRRTFESCFH